MGVEDESAGVNRIPLRLGSSAEEGFFGFGLQLTYFNQKGNLLPILVQEHGIGRGRRFVTGAVDLFASDGGGSPYVTECPAPQFITTRLRSMFLENLEYSTFDLRQSDQFDVKVWSGVMTGRILYGRTPLELIEAYTDYAGRMRPLPDWVHQGLIAGLQGGTEVVRRKLATLKAARGAAGGALAAGLVRGADDRRRQAALVGLAARHGLLSRLAGALGRGGGGGRADARLHQPLPLPAAGA